MGAEPLGDRGPAVGSQTPPLCGSSYLPSLRPRRLGSSCPASDSSSNEYTLTTFPSSSLTVGGTGTAAIITMLAVGLRGAAELLALDGPIDAGTALGAATGDPGLACLQKAWKEKGCEDRGGNSKEKGLASLRMVCICPPYLQFPYLSSQLTTG